MSPIFKFYKVDIFHGKLLETEMYANRWVFIFANSFSTKGEQSAHTGFTKRSGVFIVTGGFRTESPAEV